MPWQPPIPSGALWCKPMRDLGPAKAIIEYCYDIVGRDGWCSFKLTEIAEAMEEPYINLKRWWGVIQKANEQHHFFAEIKHRGVRGFEVRFSHQWIDWRILSTRPESAPPRSTKEVSEDVSTVIPLEDETAPSSIKRSTNEVSELIPLPRMYKVLHNDQDSSLPTSSSPTPQAQQTQPDQPMVMMMLGKGIRSDKALAQIASMGLDYSTVEQSIDNLLDDNASIPAIVRLLLTNPPAPGQPYPRARAPALAGAAGGTYSTRNGHSNGKHLRQSTGGDRERGTITETNLDDGF